MRELEAQLDQVKAEILEVQRQVARAEYERDTAATARQQALANLRSLGADSEEAALRLLADLKGDLATELRVVQEELAGNE